MRRSRETPLPFAIALSVAVCGTFGVFVMWRQSFLARDLGNVGANGQETVVYFASIARLDATQARPDGGDRDVAAASRAPLGLGFSDALGEALRAASPRFQKCRAHFTEATGTVRFRTTVVAGTGARAASRSLHVVGILRGADENPRHAECLRDKIESLNFSLLAAANPPDPEDYRLEIDVLPSVSARTPIEPAGQ